MILAIVLVLLMLFCAIAEFSRLWIIAQGVKEAAQQAVISTVNDNYDDVYVGMDFDTLVNGDYKIIIEPIAYLNYDGQQFAMTATEAALYDQVVSGNLRYWMGSLTHQNLPLAIFLEEADLGYPAWSGSTTSKVSNEQIISSLGIGIVRFNDEVEEPEVDEFDYHAGADSEDGASALRQPCHREADAPAGAGAGNHHREKAVWLSEETAQSIGGHHRGRAGPAAGSSKVL